MPIALATPAPAAAAATARPVPAAPAGRGGRLPSIDILRGAVMAIMLVDHVRAYLTDLRFDPTDLARTSAPLFLTRWITHFCAPVFILLAGMSAWLAGRRRTRRELSVFLLTRGLWLVAVEFTVVSFAWYFNFEFPMGAFGQVIWAIGVSMVALAALVWLPLPAIAAVSLAMIGGHNLLDGVTPGSLGALGPVWTALHVPGPLGSTGIFVLYPLVPWIGVLAAGYVLAGWLERRPEERPRRLLVLGAAITLGFVLLRAANVYGDPRPWAVRGDPVFTILSFLNVTKYPPSLLYLMVTLGPALLALSWLERAPRWGTAWAATFGQVAFFYYVVHLYVVHSLAVGLGMAQGFAPHEMRQLFLNLPAGYGVGLGPVWMVSAVVLVALYPLCRWYAGVKQRGRGWWWSYL
ncbi:MAG TPA: heparan-alpha-glucosaminide N-acetyltransferase domain-containing protein [Gemmatimonadales bacterium]|nr:heparan-alpha-glucosaminide N-acetyltransferase domain-containing protein [Gemmatimonadales bacterium]